MSHISTGGGASLSSWKAKTLPGVAQLMISKYLVNASESEHDLVRTYFPDLAKTERLELSKGSYIII